MSKEEKTHKLTLHQLEMLSGIVGKSICSISSDSVELIPSKPESYFFYKSADIDFWDDLHRLKLTYNYDETTSGDDFITLNINIEMQNERRAGSASIIFSGDDRFIVDKISIYGYSYHDGTEFISTENIMVLQDREMRKICFNCLNPSLALEVTMNEDLILKAIKRSSENFDEGLMLKHEIA